MPFKEYSPIEAPFLRSAAHHDNYRWSNLTSFIVCSPGICVIIPVEGALPGGLRAGALMYNVFDSGRMVLPVARPTASMEDYLETIYELIQEKGVARVTDIAAALDLQPSSVTRMIQRLDEQNFVIYERYRTLLLTEKGEHIGRAMTRRHKILENFLRLLGVHDEEVVQRDVEGIEHHVSTRTVECIGYFVDFARENEDWLQRFADYRERRIVKRKSPYPRGSYKRKGDTAP